MLPQRITSRPFISGAKNVIREGVSDKVLLQEQSGILRSFVNHVYRDQKKQRTLASFGTSATTTVTTTSNKPINALILGKPGGGKGTISGKILADFPIFHHFSTGDILRQHVRNGTPLGKEAKKHMDEGHLVPDDLMIRLVLEDTENEKSHGGSGSLLLDGFPRTIDQASALDDSLTVDLVINLDIPTETIVERIADRWIHPASGRIYSYSYKPPKKVGFDDETGEALVQRDDDKPEQVRKRLRAYDDITSPLIDFYDEKGVLKTFHGTMSDVIYVDVKKWLDDKICELNG